MVDCAVNNIQVVQEIILIDSIQNQSSYNMLYQMPEIDLSFCDAFPHLYEPKTSQTT